MEIRDGWNTALGRRKFDLTIDDGDFRALLADVGLDPGLHVSSGVKFRIMRQHAAVLSLGELVTFALSRPGEHPEEDVSAAVREKDAAVEERNRLLRQLLGAGG